MRGKIGAALVIVLMGLLAGCFGESKQKAVDRLVSDGEGRYIIHLFREGQTGMDMELLEYMNADEERLEVLQGIQLYDVRIESNKKLAKTLGLDTIPQIVLLDHEGIVLEAGEVSEAEAYLDGVLE